MSKQALTASPATHQSAAEYSGSNGRGLFIQPKLTVGSPNDHYEQQADQVADQIMRMPITASFIGNGEGNTIRKCAACEAEEKEHIQRKCSACEHVEDKIQRKPFNISPFIQKSGFDGGVANDAVSNQIESSRGGGRAMDNGTRSFMESRFGNDFSGVKIHTDSNAIQLSQALNAQAFTVGNDVFFNQGKYNPATDSGKHLLAHELTHTVQQNGGLARKVQRQRTYFGPGTMGVPTDWATQVAAAITAAQKAALIQSVIGGTVADRTSQCSADTAVNPAHLLAYTTSSPIINFDENLQSKSARAGGRPLNINAGYTLHSGSSNFVVLSAAAIDANDYYATIQTLNHELDHVGQYVANSTLTGNDSEVDAWTSSFIREFHQSYILGTTSPTQCFVQSVSQYAPLLMYYKNSTSTTEKQRAVQRISTYFTSVIQPHDGHLKAFIFWIHSTLKNSRNPDLAIDLNASTALNLGVNSSAALSTTRQFPCGNLASLTFTPPSVVPLRTTATSTSTTTPTPTK